MMSSIVNPTTYRIEVSGWDQDENFFIEKADLEWKDNEKRVALQHLIRKGALVFVRLLGSPLQNNGNPVAFEAIQINQMADQHVYEVSLRQMKPRLGASRITETRKGEVLS
jgi:hypothetical protein